MPGLDQEVKKKINRPVSDLPVADDTDLRCRAGAGFGSQRRRRRQWQQRRTSPRRAVRADAGPVKPEPGPFPARRADVSQVRPRSRPQRRLLQMPQLRREPGMLVTLITMLEKNQVPRHFQCITAEDYKDWGARPSRSRGARLAPHSIGGAQEKILRVLHSRPACGERAGERGFP